MEHRGLGAVAVAGLNRRKNALVLDHRCCADDHRVVVVVPAIKPQVRAQAPQVSLSSPLPDVPAIASWTLAFCTAKALSLW